MADSEQHYTGGSSQPKQARPAPAVPAVFQNPSVADSSNPYNVGITAATDHAVQQDDLTQYQTLRTGLVLIISTHFIHISMVLVMMYLVFLFMQAGSSLGEAVAGSDGAEFGGAIGGGAGAVVAGCCSWIFFIVTAPINLIGGCLGFSTPDITGAKSKIVGSVVCGGAAILLWLGIFFYDDLADLFLNSGWGFMGYLSLLLIIVWASHAFFVWALSDVAKYLNSPEVCSAGFPTVGLCGLSFLLVISGLGLLMRLDGWREVDMPGSSAGMWLLAGLIALVWIGMYLRLLFKALGALKLHRPASSGPGISPRGYPVQPQVGGQVGSSGVPVAQTPTRKGW